MKLKHLISYVSIGLVLSSFFISSACAKFPDIDLCGFEGKGTSDDPYVLCTYEDLMDKLQEPSNLSAHFAMYANIDARESWSQGSLSTCVAYDGTNAATAACEGWEPVGNMTNPFTGSFNGRGHSISNLWINRDLTGTGMGMGFFGVIDNPSSGGAASIRNLGLLDLNIQGGISRNNIGGLAGEQAGGTITNSYVRGILDGGAEDDYVGGLVGQQDGGTIEDSYAEGDMDGGDDNDRMGGLVGNQLAAGMIEDSYAIVDVNGEGSLDYLGGLVGRQQSGGTIENSYATGMVNGGAGGDYLGGLAGTQGGMIENSYASGAVNGGDDGDNIGGLVGFQQGGTIEDSYATGDVNGGADDDNAGGLVGQQFGVGMIENSYASGAVVGGTGDDDVGGLVGEQAGDITNSYAVGAVDGGTGDDDVGGLVGEQSGDITNSYAAGMVGGGGANTPGGLVGNASGGSIVGVNYYVANIGINGIGSGTCTVGALCLQASNLQGIFGALFRTASTTLPLGMGWMEPPWRDRNNAHPCIQDIGFGPGNGCPP